MLLCPIEDYELLSDRLDGGAGTNDSNGYHDDGEQPEEEFEAHFDPLNDIDLKVRIVVASPRSIRSVRLTWRLLLSCPAGGDPAGAAGHLVQW